jgi:hypothetical protein
MRERTRVLRRVLDPDARVASGLGIYYSIYLDRPVYSLWMATNRGERLEATESVVERHGIDVVFLPSEVGNENVMLDYVSERYELIGQSVSYNAFSVRDGVAGEPRPGGSMPKAVDGG